MNHGLVPLAYNELTLGTISKHPNAPEPKIAVMNIVKRFLAITKKVDAPNETTCGNKPLDVTLSVVTHFFLMAQDNLFMGRAPVALPLLGSLPQVYLGKIADQMVESSIIEMVGDPSIVSDFTS